MRFVPALLLNVVVAACAVVVYDQVRSTPPSPDVEGAASVDELAARVAALEAEKPVELRADGADASLRRRIEALEAQLVAWAKRKAVPSGETVGTRGVPPSGETVATRGEPTAEEIARFRTLMNAARSEDRRAKQTARLEAALAKAGVSLSRMQKGRVLAAQEEFAPRFNEIWGESKSRAAQDGGDVDWATVIRDTNRVIQGEFARRVAAFLPTADAEAVASALYPDRSK